MRMLGAAAWVFCGVVACSAGDDASGGDNPGNGDGNTRRPVQRVEVDCSGWTSLTEEQWEQCRAPRAGGHDMTLSKCDGGAIGQEYRILPTVTCSGSRCGIQPYCTTHADCNARPFGRCAGVTSATCVYPNIEPGQACDSDADCHPLSRCTSYAGLASGTHCYPTGECRAASDPSCHFAEAPCEVDADCTALPDGVCRKSILYPRCEYHFCFEDADCGASERCACGYCVQSTCKGDEECGAGQRCQAAISCGGNPSAFHCSTAADECERNADCPGGACLFNGTSWRCGQMVCGE